MKKLFILIVFIFIASGVKAQSPQFVFRVSVKNTEGYKYRISAKLWSFSKGFDKKVLKDLDVITVPDSMRGKEKNIISESSKLEYDNQLFVNDDVIAVYLIRATEEREELMTIAFAIKEFSWGTVASLENIDFVPGYFEPEINYNQESTTLLKLTVSPSYVWKEVPSADRKIILPL